MSQNIKKNISLSDYTTLQIGGVADYLVEVSTVDELQAALSFAQANTTTPPLILGGGSNVLCSDDGYRGLVIVNKIQGYVATSNGSVVDLRVGAGEELDEIIQRTITDGYWGLENLSAIPGSIGATPIQNVGAYGVEISDVIASVEALHLDTQEIKSFSPEECVFGYRDSFFKSQEGKRWCVTYVEYKLSTDQKPLLHYKDLESLQAIELITQQEIRDHVISVRSNKFPDWRSVGTAGSFFKNPIIQQSQYESVLQSYPDLPGFELPDNTVKVSLGWILDKVCKLKGFSMGKVSLYKNQALVLIADNGATAAEVEAFANHVIETVKSEVGIDIEREVLSV